jgi:hypothetical protein
LVLDALKRLNFPCGDAKRFYTIDLETLITSCPVMLPYFHIKEVAAKLNERTAAFFQDPVDLQEFFLRNVWRNLVPNDLINGMVSKWAAVVMMWPNFRGRETI